MLKQGHALGSIGHCASCQDLRFIALKIISFRFGQCDAILSLSLRSRGMRWGRYRGVGCRCICQCARMHAVKVGRLKATSTVAHSGGSITWMKYHDFFFQFERQKFLRGWGNCKMFELDPCVCGSGSDSLTTKYNRSEFYHHSYMLRQRHCAIEKIDGRQAI